MIRAWLGLALLSASWLLGLGYYHGENWPAWAICVAAGTVLLGGALTRLPSGAEAYVPAALLLPMAWMAPWPYKLAALLLLTGLVVGAAQAPVRWPSWLASGAIVAGVVLIAQALAVYAYTVFTAPSHELPGPLARLLAWLVHLSGQEVGLAGTTMSLGSMRKAHQLGATWQLLLDPPSLAFLAGGLAMVLLWTWSAGRRWRDGLRSSGTLALCVLAWLPLRALLMVALFMQRNLHTDYDARLNLTIQFYNPWLHLGLLAVPVLLARRFVAVRPQGPICVEACQRRPALRPMGAAALAMLALACMVAAVCWDPPGDVRPGRVLVDEYHSEWEPTTRPFDTEWYGHLSGYNYACIYDYCDRFFAMDRILHGPIDATTLADCSVLMLKIPTKRFAPAEIQAIERFVQRGGGLLLIGEHTSVFNSGTYLNDLSRLFGFRFRDDCLFGIDSVFEQLYVPPPVPHPIVQHIRKMDFATSCSVDTSSAGGRAVIRSTGLKNAPADYHVSNYYPQVEDRAEGRYGAFVQLWAGRHGDGRVVAFTDSTIFSNFCTFEPGKAELMLGMIDWARRSNPPNPRPWLWILGLALAGAAVWLARGWDFAWTALLAAGLLGIVVGGWAVRTLHAAGMPPPAQVRPFTRFIMDQTVCRPVLPRNGFIAGRPEGFGIFERWILRLGYFTARASGDDAFAGDVLVLAQPDMQVPPDFRDKLVRYVENGGKVLLLDSSLNRKSTANSILYPFDMSVDASRPIEGPLDGPEPWNGIPVTAACEVKGGDVVARAGGRTVAALKRVGDKGGSLTVIGFGARFNDQNMGVTGDAVPDPTSLDPNMRLLRKVYEVQFSLVRWIVEQGGPATRPASP